MYRSVDKVLSESVHNFYQYKLRALNKFHTEMYIFAPSPFHSYTISVDVLVYLAHIYLCPCVLCEWYAVFARSCGDVNLWVIVRLIS